MSTIQVKSRKAGPASETRDLHSASLLAQPMGSGKPSHDGDMMYAWSIGVTDVAREPVSTPSQTEQQQMECPPEIFIG